MKLSPELDSMLKAARGESRRDGSPIVFLTGAGVSAESGVPTFRGEEGYWRVGSKNYRPMELATHEAFSAMPDEVWAWYLYRRGVCRAAEPNRAHLAIADLDRRFGDDLLLITQNVDGLHRRAGHEEARLFEIHGNIDRMRCDQECDMTTQTIPAGVAVDWTKGRSVSAVERALLHCPRCGGRARPHVLFFDECYDEERFRFESSLLAANRASLLVVVGTAGQTNLPLQIGAAVARRGAPIVAINPEPSPFTALAERAPRGAYLQGTAGLWVPEVCTALAAG